MYCILYVSCFIGIKFLLNHAAVAPDLFISSIFYLFISVCECSLE